MNRSPVPALRHYSGQAKSDARSAAGRGQQRTELRGNARARLVLKDARLEHVFHLYAVRDANWTNTFGQRLCRTLQDQLPPIGETEIKDGVGQRLGLSRAYRTNRLKFDLDFPQVGDRCIRSIERPICENWRSAPNCIAMPSGQLRPKPAIPFRREICGSTNQPIW